MSKKDKLIALIVSRPTEATFADVRAVLEMFGWTLARSVGSHNSFRSPDGSKTIVIPTVKGRSVKRRYLDEICNLLELDIEE